MGRPARPGPARATAARRGSGVGRPAAGATRRGRSGRPAAAPAAPTSPLIGPTITGPLAIQLPPPKYTLGPLGDIYVDGIGSGLGQWQNNPFPGNRSWEPDLSNGQLFVQKTDGIFQFFVAGRRLLARHIGNAVHLGGGGDLWLPGAGISDRDREFVGLVPARHTRRSPRPIIFRFEGGKLPTLIGAEYGFSFQNINIERGLLFGQEPTFSKGGQLNYTWGPVAFSLSFNDGFDSGVYNWVTGSATYTYQQRQYLRVRRRRQRRKDQCFYLADPAAAEQLADLQPDLHL